MSRRILASFVWAAAAVAVLGLASQAPAKPPDLPVNTEHTVTPDILPDSEWDGGAPPCGMPPVESVPMPSLVPAEAQPLSAHLPPVLRRQFAATLLFGVHPLLTLVPTDQLVDMPCDHPPCAADDKPEPKDAKIIVVGTGVNSDVGLTGSIVPLPKDVHGTIQIGIGFKLNGAPTYSFRVTEYSTGGECRTDETFKGCVNTFLRAMMRKLVAEPPFVCPDIGEPSDFWGGSHPLQMCPGSPCPSEISAFEGGFLLSQDVLDYMEKLREAERFLDAGRRLAAHGSHAAARECFEECNRLCPGILADCDKAEMNGGSRSDLEVMPGCCEEEEEAPPQTSREAMHLLLPGVEVMADGLMKSCRQSLSAGRVEHALDLARQAYALDPTRVQGDPVICKLYRLTAKPAQQADCCKDKKCTGDCCDDCPECPNCPWCLRASGQTGKPLTIIVLGGTFMPDFGNPWKINAAAKAIAKPCRHTVDAPAGVGKGD